MEPTGANHSKTSSHKTHLFTEKHKTYSGNGFQLKAECSAVTSIREYFTSQVFSEQAHKAQTTKSGLNSKTQEEWRG